MSPLEPSDDALVATLLQKGLVSPRQVAECKRVWADRAAAGETITLADVLVERGFLDPGALAQTMSDSAVPPASSGRVPPEVLAARADPKRVMGKYTLVRELGRGGMAVVHKAWDELLSHYVALKLILSQEAGPSGASGDEHVQEFLREARTAVKMSHPSIVRVYELGRHGERHYLSMEYIEGHTLRALIEEGRDKRDTNFYSNPPRFIAMMIDVALALDYAHRLDPPVVHRDIKPHNILVDKRGKAFVVDFGLAKELRAEGRLTISGVVKGTPCYMSPEQVQGRALDGRTDLYALGAVLYELLTGRPPFLGRNNHEILNRVVNEEPVRPSVAVRGIHRPPAALEAICLKALEKDPTRRYRTGRQFADDLLRFMKGQAVEARPAGTLDRAVRWMMRRKAVTAAMAFAVLMTIVAIAALASRRSAEERPVVAEDPSDAKLRQATKRIEEIASSMEFGRAAKAVEELMARLNEGTDKTLLRGRLEEIRVQESLHTGLVARMQQGPRDYAAFHLRQEKLANVRVIDATKDHVVLRYEGRAVEVPWGKIAPAQYVTLVRDYWSDAARRCSDWACSA
jgi:serine/threonine-protein kinase